MLMYVAIAVNAMTSMTDPSESKMLLEGLIEALEDWNSAYKWESLRPVGNKDCIKGAF
jgi:hypothetical protein